MFIFIVLFLTNITFLVSGLVLLKIGRGVALLILSGCKIKVFFNTMNYFLVNSVISYVQTFAFVLLDISQRKWTNLTDICLILQREERYHE